MLDGVRSLIQPRQSVSFDLGKPAFVFNVCSSHPNPKTRQPFTGYRVRGDGGWLKSALLEQGQHVLLGLIGLRDHRGARLAEDLGLGQRRGFGRIVGVHDAAAGV